jgi:hypothetical protein
VALNEVGMQLFQRNQYVQAFDYFCQCVHQLPDVLEYRLNRFHAVSPPSACQPTLSIHASSYTGLLPAGCDN